jgi:integrase/recombinase XerC
MPAPAGDAAEPADAESFPNWFTQFLNDRQTRKPSAHTTKAYRQDFIAIANLMTDGNPAWLTMADITKDSMRHAFAAYARDHEAASIRRCWSTWNALCTFLYTGEQLAANPMQLVGRICANFHHAPTSRLEPGPGPASAADSRSTRSF